jgi:hypothetical protein
MAVLAAIATASPVSRRSSSGGTSLPLRRIQRHPHSLVRRDASEIIPQGQNPALLVLDVDIG